MASADAMVAGAGPGGCTAALSLARSGARVVLAGPRGTPDRGLFGEWLHPAGVEALRRLGVRLDGDGFTENRGFVVHPDLGRPPMVLPYPRGRAVSMCHHVLVDRLRQAVADQSAVTLQLGQRVTGVSGNGCAVTTAGLVQADLLVGADGRASLMRRTLRPGEPAAVTLSATAGFELAKTRLPVEGYGHIFLGGPGPVLAYRIGDDAVRLSFDVAPGRRSPAAMIDHLRHRYAPALPQELRAAFLREAGPQSTIRWAANRFRRRQFYGHGRLALLGDAVGFGHPLAAQGMTMAILDAETLGRRGNIKYYARERRARSWAPERLGLALHRAMTDVSSVILREALFHLWCHDTGERDRMMRLLAVQEDRRTEFGLAVARIATAALRGASESNAVRPASSALAQRGRTAVDLASWLLWLCGSAVTRP